MDLIDAPFIPPGLNAVLLQSLRYALGEVLVIARIGKKRSGWLIGLVHGGLLKILIVLKAALDHFEQFRGSFDMDRQMIEVIPPHDNCRKLARIGVTD